MSNEQVEEGEDVREVSPDGGSGRERRPGPWRVLKFGGSSLAGEERIGRVARIVQDVAREGACRPLVVVSALEGTTDDLATALREAAEGDDRTHGIVGRLRDRHLAVAGAVSGPGDRDRLASLVNRIASDLEEVLHGVRLLRECTPRIRDRVLAVGEILSAEILAAALRAGGLSSRARDARDLVVTDERHGRARVEQETTFARIREALGDATDVPTLSGFVGSTPEGETTTLGRGGSDYTATIVGAALDAERVEIWTDVDGIMTADPRAVEDPQPLDEITYDELLELSNFGARVVFPPAVYPVREGRIPLTIRNTLNPSFPGTRVVATLPQRPSRLARAIAAVADVGLIRLEGVERIGRLEAAERALAVLRRREAGLLLFSQDCSGHSLTLAVGGREVDGVVEGLIAEFDWERARGLLGDPSVERERSIVALVGEEMRETPGVAGRFFGVLGSHGINVHAIAQGSSERNISCVVDAAERDRAIRRVHEAFFGEGSSTSPSSC